MKTYSITNDISGANLGTWIAEDREHALVAQFRAAGLRAEVIDGAVALDPRDVDADGVHLAGRVEDYTITETRFIIENASGHLADDLGDQGRGENFGWSTEAEAEAALENLAETTGWDLDDYSVREATAEEIAEEIAHDAQRVARSLEILRRAQRA